MSSRSIGLDERSWRYLCDVSVREPVVLRELREETAELDEAAMQISPEQGQLMALLARLTDARHYLEVGVFTGYSSLAVALALPPDGEVVACDSSETWTAVARRFWAAAGVAGKIELRLGPALETLDALIEEGRAGQFDFAFIDADKSEYLAYYTRILELLRSGGLLAADNTLWSGRVADPDCHDATTQALRRFNAHLHSDARIDLCLVPIGDGLTLARKR